MNVDDVAQINLRPVQEFVGDRFKQVFRINRSVQESLERGIGGAVALGRRSVRTGVGFGALAYDQAALSVQSSWQWVERAEAKGVDMERELSTQIGDRVHALEKRAGQELRRTSVRLKENPAVAGRRRDNRQLDRVLTAIVPGNGQALSRDIAQPADYDGLTVPQVKSRLAAMNVNELQSLRDYESAHKARVTVLQAIDAEIRNKLVIA